MKKRNKIALGFLGVLLSIILVCTGVLYYYVGKINKVKTNKEDFLVEGQEQKENDYFTVALYGTDYMGDEIGAADSIMLLSINTKENKIKLCSIMRDTYVYLPDGSGNKRNINYTMSDNGAANGSVYLTKTINYNFDLQIDKFVQVDLKHLPTVIDKMGGVELNITEEEREYINGIIIAIDKNNGTKTQEVKKAGNITLNGTQAAAYARIRSTEGKDFKRTERQRDVIEALISKASSMSYTELVGLLSEMLPLVTTNMSSTEILSVGSSVLLNGITEVEQSRFPLDENMTHEWTDMYHINPDFDLTTKAIKTFLYGIE